MPFDLSTATPMQQQAMPQNLTGEDYLKTLPANAATLIKKYANGELAVTPQMTRTPAGVQLLGAIAQYDPTFDATNYQKRQQTATAFAKGKQADAIRGANQALYHMGNLYQKTEDLNNTNILPAVINPIVNYVEEKGLGDVRQGKYRQSAQAVASELRRVFAGAGGGSLAELTKWEEGFDPNAGEAQQKAHIQNGVDLLRGALGALNNQYQEGMGLNKNVNDLLSPEARHVYESLQLNQNPNALVTKAPQVKKTPGQKMGDALTANIPQGISPQEWAAMSPQDKALWAK